MPKLRESILRKRRGGPIETFTEEDENGNLSIWQEGGEDMDPYQAGVQDQPSVGAPPDPNAKPIFMTNIPQGGFGPSYENPGGVPGSEQDRAQMEEQAKAAGSTVMDLSEKKKTPKPPAWVNPDIDLNAPGERDRFRSILIQDNFGGYDMSTMNINAEMKRSNLDPVTDKKAWDERFERLTKEKLAATTLMEQLMKPYDKAATLQEAIRKRNAETEKAKGVDLKAARAKYLELGNSYVKTLTDKQKLIESLGTAFDETAKSAINAQIQELDNFASDIKFQMKGLEGTPGVKPVKTPTEMMPSHAKTGQAPTAGTTQQTEAQKFAAEGKAKGWGPDQVLAEWKKLKTSGAGKTTSGKPAPPKPAPAKIIKPAPTAKSSGVSGSWGPPPPTPSTPQTSGASINIGGPPVTINTKDMVDLAKSVGINRENLDAALEAAAAAGGFTIDILLTKPKNVIKRLLELAVSSQSATRKQMGL